jgi:UDP-glucuronate decarboxylase
MTSRNYVLENFTDDYFEKNIEFTNLASQISDKSFFLTGGSGVFGSWVLHYFNWLIKKKLASPKITILVRNKVNIYKYDFIKYVVGDIINFEHSDEKFDHMLHLAAPSALDTFNGMGNIEKIDQLFFGTRNVIKFAKKSIMSRSLMVSSGAIYGGFPEMHTDPISEDCRKAPLSTDSSSGLAMGKKISETLFMLSNNLGEINMSIARCFSFVGPGLPFDIHYAIGNFINDIIEGNNIKINGNGKPVRSFMYLGDMVYWILNILFFGKDGRDYNVGSNFGINMHNLALLIIKLLDPDKSVELRHLSNESKGNPANFFYVPSIERARTELNLKEMINLNDSILLYASYIKKIKNV